MPLPRLALLFCATTLGSLPPQAAEPGAVVGTCADIAAAYGDAAKGARALPDAVAALIAGACTRPTGSRPTSRRAGMRWNSCSGGKT